VGDATGALGADAPSRLRVQRDALHEHYFSGLRSGAEPHPPSGSALAAALAESFGSLEQWQAAFHAVGESRGVGWVILFQDPTTHWLTNHWISLHQEGVPAGFTPLLVMDVWEHAFMRDYKATERGVYIEAFFRNIDWRMIEQRLPKTSALRLAQLTSSRPARALRAAERVRRLLPRQDAPARCDGAIATPQRSAAPSAPRDRPKRASALPGADRP
jgi:hypothetical protein